MPVSTPPVPEIRPETCARAALRALRALSPHVTVIRRGAVVEVRCGDTALAHTAATAPSFVNTLGSVELAYARRDDALLKAAHVYVSGPHVLATLQRGGRMRGLGISATIAARHVAALALGGPAWQRAGAALLRRTDSVGADREVTTQMWWALDGAVWHVHAAHGWWRVGTVADPELARTWLTLAAAQGDVDGPPPHGAAVRGAVWDAVDALQRVPHPQETP